MLLGPIYLWRDGESVLMYSEGRVRSRRGRGGQGINNRTGLDCLKVVSGTIVWGTFIQFCSLHVSQGKRLPKGSSGLCVRRGSTWQNRQ